MGQTVRNVAIVLVLAAVVAFVPGGGKTSDTLVEILQIAFLGGLAWVAYRLYRENRMTLEGLGDRNRAILYGAIGLAVLAVAGTDKLWSSGAGTLVWFVMVAGACAGVFMVYRASREY